MEKRLLVLGAGRHQVPLIRRAEELGVRVVVADYLPDSPGKRLATYPTMTDAVDTDAVLALAREYRVDGITTTGTDMPVRAMAEVAAALDLPCFVSPEHARIATDKILMKDAFAARGVRVAAHRLVEGAADRELIDTVRLPAVVKPTDSQGQRGTSRVDDRARLPAAIDAALAASRSRRVLVEEHLPGFEVTASAWVSRGEVRLLALTDRVTYNPPPAIGIAVRHVFPSRHGEHVVDAVRAALVEIAVGYGLDEGPLYVQFVVADGEPHLIEAACRVGGGHENALVPLATGVDLTDRLVDYALTGTCEPVEFDYSRRDPCVHALVQFLLARPGTVGGCAGMEALVAERLVAEGAFYYPSGHVQAEIVDSLGRVGYFVAADATRDALEGRARAAFDRLSMRDESGREMLFWPPAELTLG